MTLVELSAELYQARSAYCKAKSDLEFHRARISYLKQMHDDKLRGFDLYAEMFEEQ